MGIKWQGDKVKLKVRAFARARTKAAAIDFTNFIKIKLSELHPSKEARKVARRAAKRKDADSKGEAGKAKLGSKAPGKPRRPGKYPYLRTGHLRRGHHASHDPIEPRSRSGTSVPYGRTLHYRGYPYMKMALAERLAVLQRILSEGKLE